MTFCVTAFQISKLQIKQNLAVRLECRSDSSFPDMQRYLNLPEYVMCVYNTSMLHICVRQKTPFKRQTTQTAEHVSCNKKEYDNHNYISDGLSLSVSCTKKESHVHLSLSFVQENQLTSHFCYFATYSFHVQT